MLTSRLQAAGVTLPTCFASTGGQVPPRYLVRVAALAFDFILHNSISS